MKQYFQAIYWLPLVKRAYAVVPEWIRKQPLVNRISNYVLNERFFTDALYRTEFLLYPGFARTGCMLLCSLYLASVTDPYGQGRCLCDCPGDGDIYGCPFLKTIQSTLQRIEK